MMETHREGSKNENIIYCGSPSILVEPTRLLKLKVQQADDIILQQLRKQLNSGVLYLDPYLREHLGSTSPHVEALLRTILITFPLVKYDASVALRKHGLVYRDHDGRSLPFTKKLLFLLSEVYLPVVVSTSSRLQSLIFFFEHRLWRILLSATRLLNFVLFVCRGKYTTLSERFLRMTLMQSGESAQRRAVVRASLRDLLWEALAAAIIACISILPWRPVILILKTVFSLLGRKMVVSDFGCGDCAVCKLPANQPCTLICRHSFCYWCLEACCRLPLGDKFFCCICAKFFQRAGVEVTAQDQTFIPTNIEMVI